MEYESTKNWKGKRGIVIGTSNTAHDVAEEMLETGLDSVTMVQRGRTAVFPIEHQEMWSDPFYDANSSMESDRLIMGTPLALTRLRTYSGTILPQPSIRTTLMPLSVLDPESSAPETCGRRCVSELVGIPSMLLRVRKSPHGRSRSPGQRRSAHYKLYANWVELCE